jgi:uncharacterized protein involved in exopolysaccharide biosynthesis
LVLEIDALGSAQNQSRGNSVETDVLPIQIQIAGREGLSSNTVEEQIAFLGSLVSVIEVKLSILEAEAEALEPDILDLQKRLQEVRTQESRLTLATEVARETVMTLSRKVAETGIAAQDETGDVRLASRATVPDEPVAPRKMLNTAVAGAMGLMVAVFGAFAFEYWRSGEKTS